MAERWHIRGEYLESCSCDVLCPCLLGARDDRALALARPTHGYCDVPMVFQVSGGHYGGVALDGLRAAFSAHTPEAMGLGHWTFALYLDERATPAQRTALEAIFGGASGGPIGALLAPLVEHRRPTRVVSIDFGKEGRRCWARIPGVLDVEIEGIEGRAPGSETWIDNVRHFVSGRLAAARATRSSYRDHGWAWSHVGRNGHYATFDWAGP